MPIKLNGSGSGSVALNAPANTSGGSDISFTLPTADGTSGQVLQTNGSGALSFASASSDNITEGNTTAEVVDTGSDGHFKVTTEGTEALRVDSSRRLLVGTNTNRTGFALQLEGTNYNQASLSLTNNQNTGNSGYIYLTKTRGTAVGSNTIVNNGDPLGIIEFAGADGSNLQAAAKIEARVDGTPGTNDMPGRLVFYTTADGSSSSSERMRITREGALMAQAGGGISYSTNDHHHQLVQTANNYVLNCYNNNASVTAELLIVQSTAVQSSGRSLMKLWSGNGGVPSDTEFHLRMDGNGYADGSWNGGGADYAEFFEWSDGNTSEEDRRGISVVLDGDKIREAVAGEEPIGVISANPSVVGDTAWNSWREKYLRDDYGTSLMEDYTAYEWIDENGTKHSYPIDNVPDGLVVPDDATTTTTDEQGNTLRRRILNPDYDPDVEYRPREQRPEWDCVGLMGKLRIRKGQVTGARWIKMRDISDTVEEWLVR